MAAPLKPWEIAGVNRQNCGVGSFDSPSWHDSYNYGHDRRSLYRSVVRSYGGGGLAGGANGTSINKTGGSRTRIPPPIPPRSDKSQQPPHGSMFPRYSLPYNNFNPYSSFSGSFCSPMYSGYGFGSRFGYSQDYYNTDNSFVRLAEESSRPAFQSIESIVHAVASVSMMLESTYHAVYSSFRAVIGVADHFSRLKNHLSHVLTTLSLIRTLRWLCLKALHLLGIIKENPSNEAAWSAATKEAQDILDGDIQRQRSSWPILMFFGVVFGAPWLIWRLLSHLTTGPTSGALEWNGKQDNHYIGVALFDFEGDGDQELSFNIGQEIYVAPRSYQPRIRGWLRASVDGKKTGLVPSNYIKVMGLRKGTSVKHTPTETEVAAPTELSQQAPVASDLDASPNASVQNGKDADNNENCNIDDSAEN